MSRQGMTETGSIYSQGVTKIEPETRHQVLMENFLFRLKDDKSYQIQPHSIQLLTASSESLSPRKYKPEKFEFRAMNTVTKEHLRIAKIHQNYKEEAEKLLFQIGRSKYRYLQQVVDVLTDFDIPEEASPSKGSISKSAMTFSWNESSLHSPTKPSAGGSSLSIYNMGMPYSWMDENSEFIWVVMEDVLGDPEDPSNLQMLMVDKEMEAGDFEDENAGFSQPQFIQIARQLVGAVAQMQLLGRPHGNICPKAFGVKPNGVVRLSSLFEQPCSQYGEARGWADAYWNDSKAKKWSFKDDAMALGQIMLSMMLIGIHSPDDTYKNFTKLCNEGRQKLGRKIPYEKVQKEHEQRRRVQHNKYFTALSRFRKKFDPNLVSIVMKLIEPNENHRLDALGALNFIQNFYKFSDFEFSEMLMSEVQQANDRLSTFESQDGKFEFSLNKSGRPPAQGGSDDQSLIEDQFEPQEILGSPVHAKFLKSKENIFEETEDLKTKVSEEVAKFLKEKEEKVGILNTLENINEITYESKGWQNINGMHKVIIPQGVMSVTGKGIYKGSWQKGERKGFGIFECEQFTYAGYWDKDKPNGWGEKFYKLGQYQGDKYVGGFLNGLRDGLGEYNSDQGDHIFGTWVKDLQIGLVDYHKKPIKGAAAPPAWYRGYAKHLSFQGFGVLIVNEGAEQEELAGNFMKDKLQGFGTHVVKNTKYIGYFKENEYNGFGMQENELMISIGTFKKYQQDGWCTVRYKNGDFYLGEMKGGVIEGFGLMAQNGVVQYNGQFCEGMKAGKGRMIRIGDFQYIGGFCNNKRHGFGVMISFDKWSYEGYFNQGKREGIGVLVMDEGQLHSNLNNMTKDVEEDAVIETREALGNLIEKLGPLHS